MMDVRLLLVDVDGTLTDGSVYVSETGKETFRFHTRDFQGIRLLQEKNDIVVVALTSREYVEGVDQRFRNTSIGYEYDVQDKFDYVLKNFIIPSQEVFCRPVLWEHVAFIGDDTQDKKLLESVGFPFCPADADESILDIPDIMICSRDGGRGAVREVCNFIHENME